jgi:hypothetical protein
MLRLVIRNNVKWAISDGADGYDSAADSLAGRAFAVTRTSAIQGASYLCSDHHGSSDIYSYASPTNGLRPEKGSGCFFKVKEKHSDPFFSVLVALSIQQ